MAPYPYSTGPRSRITAQPDLPGANGQWNKHDAPKLCARRCHRDAAQRLPVGRVGEADELAETYLYLMREGFSTGQVIVVDGGAVLV